LVGAAAGLLEEVAAKLAAELGADAAAGLAVAESKSNPKSTEEAGLDEEEAEAAGGELSAKTSAKLVREAAAGR